MSSVAVDENCKKKKTLVNPKKKSLEFVSLSYTREAAVCFPGSLSVGTVFGV